MQNKERILTKEYLILTIANFFVASNFYAHLVIGASFAIYHLQVSETKAGIAAGLYVVGALTSRLIFSKFGRQRYFKKILLIDICIMILFTALHITVSSFAIFCVFRFLLGATYGISSNISMTFIALIIPENRKGEGVAWYTMSQTLGMAIGPFFAVYIMHLYGFSSVFLTFTIFMAAALAILFFIKQPEETKTTAPDTMERPTGDIAIPPEERGIWQVFERSAIKVAFLCVIVYMGSMNYQSFAPVFITESGAPALSSVIFLVSAGAMLAVRPLIGKIFDKHGPNMLILFGLIIFSAGFFLLGQGKISLFILSVLFIGVGLSSIYSTTLTIVVSNSPRHRLNVANATYFFSLDLGAAIGPAIGGIIVENLGYNILYYVFAVVMAACIPLYFGFIAKRRT